MEFKATDEKNPNVLVIDGYAVRNARIKARQLKRRPEFRRDDYHDIVAEFLADLVLRLPRFNPMTASRNTFVTRLLRNKTCNMIDRRMTLKREQESAELSLSTTTRNETDSSIQEYIAADPHGRTSSNDPARPDLHDLQIDVRAAIDSLPPELKTLARQMQTQTITEISKLTGIPRGTLYERVTKIRNHFQRLGLDRY